MKKLAILILAMAALSMLVASVSIANVPAPPVNQTIGFDDKEFDGMTTAQCLECHSSGIPDRHHMLYGSAMPQGICAATTGLCEDGITECANDNGCAVACTVTPRECYIDDNCQTGVSLCSNGAYMPGVSECVDAATDCDRQYQGPICTTAPYCAGTSAAAAVPGSQDNGGVYGCLTCHEEDTSGGVTNFIVERECINCHIQLPNSPSVHHLDEAKVLAKAGLCVACHGDVVDDVNPTSPNYAGDDIPTYDPSLVTPGSVTTERICTETGWGPSVSCTEDADCSVVSPTSVCDTELHKADTAQAGSCDFCHDAGTDTDSGIAVHDNYDTHHHTGVYKDRYGNTDDLGTGDSRTICSWCHYTGYPHNPGALDPVEIRTCENCHGMESLHSIQADSDASGDIVVGGELAGYGHVGEDTPGAGSDCWGCHGFSMGSASAPGSEVIVPTISSGSVSVPAGTDTQIVITGNALKGAAIELTPALGTITPGWSGAEWSVITVNVPAGTYDMVANNAGEKSGAVSLIAKPATGITATIETISCSSCVDGNVTITGSGFGGYVASAGEYLNVTQGGAALAIVSWTDTEIVASGYDCEGGEITVNGLFGSATK